MTRFSRVSGRSCWRFRRPISVNRLLCEERGGLRVPGSAQWSVANRYARLVAVELELDSARFLVRSHGYRGTFPGCGGRQ